MARSYSPDSIAVLAVRSISRSLGWMRSGWLVDPNWDADAMPATRRRVNPDRDLRFFIISPSWGATVHTLLSKGGFPG